MKATIKVKKEVDIKYVSLEVAVRYDEEDIPNDFPLREGDIWKAVIEIETGTILNWPKGETGEFYMKVCDQGTYHLIDSDGNTVASIEDDYVPNCLLPGDYGDYLDFKINADGRVTNWYKNPSFDNFFKDEDDD